MRTLVLLLVGLPLLMPPGMCICQFVPCGKASAAQTQAPTPATPPGFVAPPAQDECCCKNRKKAAKSEQPRAQKTASEPQKPADDSRPCPAPGKHWPGCPAIDGVAEARFTMPPAPPLFDVDLTIPPVTFATLPVRETAPVSAHTVRHLSAPIVIAYCTLLI